MWAFVVRFLTYLIVVGVSLALTSHTADQALTAPAPLTFQLPEAPQAPVCVLSDGVCAEFTWQVADRFMEVWKSWGSPGNPGNYSPSVLRQPFFLTLDACSSRGGNTAIASYDWTVLGGDRPGWLVHRLAESCRIAIPVPTEGTYYVLLTVRAHDGEAASTMQRVSISDVLIVSIGDSYASGEGNPDVLFGPTAPAGEWQDRRCHRSRLSGPAQAALELERRDPRSTVTFLSYACSGATIREGLIREYWGQVPLWPPMVPQIKAAARLLCGDDVCDRPDDPTIDALLISIGGNDVGFAVAIIACAARLDDIANRTFRRLIDVNLIPNRDCHQQPSLARHLEERLRELPGLYAEVRREIRNRLKVRAVFITEYPVDLFDSGAGCGSLELVTAEEAQWLAGYGQRLNQVIRDSWGAAVVDIASAFAGHGYCGTPTFYGHLGQSLGRQLDYLGLLHPNADGHRVYRDAILRKLQPAAMNTK